jgi:hypothetical protein
VTGLRREEAAKMAGISVENYTRLERGRAAGTHGQRGAARLVFLDPQSREFWRDWSKAAQ